MKYTRHQLTTVQMGGGGGVKSPETLQEFQGGNRVAAKSNTIEVNGDQFFP